MNKWIRLDNKEWMIRNGFSSELYIWNKQPSALDARQYGMAPNEILRKSPGQRHLAEIESAMQMSEENRCRQGWR